MQTFNDGYTKIMHAKINDWGLERIYEIEDDIQSLEQNEQAIIDYLKDIRCSMPLGLALRRYLCGKFGEKNESDGRTESSVHEITGEERTAEIARIIGGINVTEKQLAAAREMLSRNA